MLQQYVVQYAIWQTALEKVREFGSVSNIKGKLQKSPFQATVDDSGRNMAELLRRYGSPTMTDELSLEDDERLNGMRRDFVRHFCRLRNATKAALAAGYSEKNARREGSKLLNLPEIKGHIARQSALIARDINISTELLLQMFMDEALGKGPDTTSNSRIQAMSQIARHMGFYAEDNAQLNPVEEALDGMATGDLEDMANALKQYLSKDETPH